MFRTVVLAPDRDFGKAVERLALESRQLFVAKSLSELPGNGYELGRLIGNYDPEIVILEITTPETGLEFAEQLRSIAPKVACLALGGRISPALERQFHAAGAAMLNGAFSHGQFQMAVKEAIHAARSAIIEPLFAFLPAKAGSGATTVAFNLATAMAQTLQKKTFLLEADLHSGVISTLLDVKPKLPLIDALENSANLDYSSWSSYVITAHSTDFLLTDRVKKTPLPTWVQYHQLLRFAAGRYDAVFVDLPEVVNEATEEVVQLAQFTFVVCTPELTSLKLAEQRLQELKARAAPPERLRLILNRWHKSDMGPDQVASMLGHPVAAVFKNDYRSISKAIASCHPVGVGAELGRSFVEFGRTLLQGKQECHSNGAVSRARFSFF